MNMNLAVSTGVHLQLSKSVPMKELIINSKQIRAILSLGARGEIKSPDQKHKVDILI